LLEEIEQQATSLGLVVPLLVEVNVSGDATKHGFEVSEVRNALLPAAKFTHVRLLGLMTMASREGDLAQARQDFQKLRTLRDELQSSFSHSLTLPELSMGMSGDFEVAIEEGATMVRIGSALFEGVVA
jgi:uncharacterized pyridoxal phosphate-containing UPF0001 family protein